MLGIFIPYLIEASVGLRAVLGRLSTECYQLRWSAGGDTTGHRGAPRVREIMAAPTVQSTPEKFEWAKSSDFLPSGARAATMRAERR